MHCTLSIAHSNFTNLYFQKSIKKSLIFQMSGFACFVFSLSVTMICYGLTFAMERSEFYQHYYVQLAENQTKAKEDDRPMGCQKMTSVLMETFKIYCDFGYSVWNYILITLINFTTTLCVFPAVCQLGSSYEYQKSKYKTGVA